MSTQNNSQIETITKMVERLQAKPNKHNELELTTPLKQTGETPYYLQTCLLQNVLRVCKGALYFIAEQPQTKEVDCYDVINTLEVAEQINDTIMNDIDILDTLAKFQLK